jgi:hypothetical protein
VFASLPSYTLDKLIRYAFPTGQLIKRLDSLWDGRERDDGDDGGRVPRLLVGADPFVFDESEVEDEDNGASGYATVLQAVVEFTKYLLLKELGNPTCAIRRHLKIN